MGVFRTINLEAKERKLDFLVIGGLAVIFHAYPRETADLDMLIRRDQRDSWVEFFTGLSYTIYNDAGHFLQLNPPAGIPWPVDLMLVREPTFHEIFQAGIEVEMYGEKILIPTLEHLIALKLHALKFGNPERHSKDFMDVENLVRANKVDLASEKVRELFLKYGTLELYEKISGSCSG